MPDIGGKIGKAIGEGIGSPGNFFTNLVAGASGKTMNPWVDTRCANAFPVSAAKYLTVEGVKKTQSLVSDLYSSTGKENLFVFKKALRNFKDELNQKSKVIIKALQDEAKNKRVFEPAQKAYLEAKKEAEKYEASVKSAKTELESYLSADVLEESNKTIKEAQAKFEKQVEESRKKVSSVRRNAESKIDEAKDDARKVWEKGKQEAKAIFEAAKISAVQKTAELDNAKKDAQAKLDAFAKKENLEKILKEYAQKKKIKGKDLEKFNKGEHSWRITSRDSSKTAKLAYLLYYKPKDRDIEKLWDDVFPQERAFLVGKIPEKFKNLQEHYGFLHADKPKFGKTYAHAKPAWLVLRDKPEFKGKFEELKQYWDLTHDEKNPVFTGKYADLQHEWNLIQKKPVFTGGYKTSKLEDDWNLTQDPPKFTGAYTSFEKLYKMESKTKLGKGEREERRKAAIGQITAGEKHSAVAKYVGAVDNFNKARADYKKPYEQQRHIYGVIKGELEAIQKITDELLKDQQSGIDDAVAQGADKKLHDKVKRAQKGERKDLVVDRVGRLPFPAALAVYSHLVRISTDKTDADIAELEANKPAVLSTQKYFDHTK